MTPPRPPRPVNGPVHSTATDAHSAATRSGLIPERRSSSHACPRGIVHVIHFKTVDVPSLSPSAYGPTALRCTVLQLDGSIFGHPSCGSSGGSAPSTTGRGPAHRAVRGNARLPEGGDVRCASACASRCMGGRGGAAAGRVGGGSGGRGGAAAGAGRCRAGVGVGVEKRARAFEGTQPNHISISISISISTRLARLPMPRLPLVLTYEAFLGSEHEAAVGTRRRLLIDRHVP